MKNSAILLILVAVAVVFSAFLKNTSFYNNMVDRMVWSQTRSELRNQEVFEIALSSRDSAKMSEEDRQQFFNALLDAKFHESNWRRFGPTGVPVTLHYEDGGRDVFVWWGGAIFEHSRSGRQFLISSDKLGALVEKYYGPFN